MNLENRSHGEVKGDRKMAVKEITGNEELTLKLDNGDYEKFKEVLDKWKFKDSQSFLRFAISVMLLTERNVLYIDKDGFPEGKVPAEHLIKKEDVSNDA